MSSFVYKQILAAIVTNGAVGRVLSPAENDAYRLAVVKKFGGGRPHWRLWDTLTHAVGLQDRAGWQLLDGFMPPTPVLLLLDDLRTPFGCARASGRDVVPILGETKHFEFSIASPELDFVICFNAYDFLIACGTASGWLRGLRDTLDP